MLIFLKNYKVSARPFMRICRYQYRKSQGDWIVEDGKVGRWHARLKEPKVIEIHYDLYIDGKHSVFRMPQMEREERTRILRRTDFLKKHDLTEEQLISLLNTYA